MKAQKISKKALNNISNKSGSITVLSIGVMALCLLLIFLGSVVYSSLLVRSRTQTIADAAALAGANAYDYRDIELVNEKPRVKLKNQKVQDAVTSYLNKLQLPEELQLKALITSDFDKVSVTLGGVWHPPFIGLILPEGIYIVETATARTYFR